MTHAALVADDHPLYRLGIVRAFDRPGSGFTVAGEAENGPGTLAALLRLRPDLAVLDLRMPGGDGISVFAQARALDPALPTVALLMTADLTPAIKARALAAGFAAALPKDTSRADMLQAAAAALGRAATHGDAAAVSAA